MVQPRVCLNMIVKNEAAIIERCLASMIGVVECYVICDTGYTDNTVEIITSFFQDHGIPGEIIHTDFKDFSQARNEALSAAQNSKMDFDYILLCDADMEMQVLSPNWNTDLIGRAHMIEQKSSSGLEYPNLRMVQKSLPCKYVGVTHEYLDTQGAPTMILSGLGFFDHEIGSNRAEKYDRDIRLLTEGLKAEPNNSRYIFYLGNSYLESGRLPEAIDCYQKRITMGGYNEEVFISKYRIGRAYARLGEEAQFIKQMLDTFDEFQDRAEPIYTVANKSLSKRQYRLALGFAEMGMQVPKPNSKLFVEGDVYDWRLPDVAAVALYWLGRPAEALKINLAIIDLVPPDQRGRIVENIKFCESKLGVEA